MSGSKHADRREALQRLKPYPAYKDSGVEWLAEIPTDWEVKRLKTVAAIQLSNVDKKSLEGQESVRLCNYTDVYYHERITGDLEFMLATATSEQVRKFTLRAGDVLITKDSESWTDIAVSAVIGEDLSGVLCGYHLAHIRPRHACYGPYLARAFSAVGPRDQFQVAANGITRFGLGSDAIATGVFAMPSEPEQRAIAAFLDRETARVDVLVAKKERLIGLLQEQRTALINRAVTKGLNRNIPMKKSGVEWLGEMPEHWEVKRLRHVVKSVKNGTTAHQLEYGESEYRVTRIETISTGTIEPSKTGFVCYTPDLDQYRLEPGDVLLSHINSVSMLGNCALYELEMPLYSGMNLLRLRPNGAVSGRWLWNWLRSTFGRESVRSRCKPAINQASVPIGSLKSMAVFVPPLREQEAISAFLDCETARIDALVAKVRDAIDRLKELRTALISAAVMGKIDVRGEAE